MNEIEHATRRVLSHTTWANTAVEISEILTLASGATHMFETARELRRALVRARQDGAVDPELLDGTKWLEEEGE